MDPIQSSADINKFNFPVIGAAKYKGIDKNGNTTKEINSHGKFASRTVKQFKSVADRVDRFFHLKSKSFVNRKLKERKTQNTLTNSRAGILNSDSLTPQDAVSELYQLTHQSDEAGIKKEKLDQIINRDVYTLLTHKINSSTNTKDLKEACDGFYENHENMTEKMIKKIEKQITNRLKKMVNSLDDHFNRFPTQEAAIDHYALTRSKCELINSILKLAEAIKLPTKKNDSYLVNMHQTNLRKHMSKIIKTDLEVIAKKLKKEKKNENTSIIRTMLDSDFGYKNTGENRKFDNFFRIGSHKTSDEIPNSLKKIRADIKKILESFPQ